MRGLRGIVVPDNCQTVRSRKRALLCCCLSGAHACPKVVLQQPELAVSFLEVLTEKPSAELVAGDSEGFA